MSKLCNLRDTWRTILFNRKDCCWWTESVRLMLLLLSIVLMTF